MLNIRQMTVNIIPTDDHKYITMTRMIENELNSYIGVPSGGTPSIRRRRKRREK